MLAVRFETREIVSEMIGVSVVDEGYRLRFPIDEKRSGNIRLKKKKNSDAIFVELRIFFFIFLFSIFSFNLFLKNKNKECSRYIFYASCDRIVTVLLINVDKITYGTELH